MRHLKLAAVLFLLGATGAHATVIGYTTAPPTGRTSVDANAQVLPDGSQFLIGTFSNPGNISLLGSVAAIQAAGGWSEFIPLAGGNGATEREAIITIGGTFPGKMSGQAANNTAAATAFNNQPLYLMVFNTSSAGTATQVGIFRASAATTPWIFPVNNNGLGDSVTINVDDTSAAALGGVGTVNNTPGTLRFGLTALVPEPSSVALLVPGLIGLLGYRRLRRNS